MAAPFGGSCPSHSFSWSACDASLKTAVFGASFVAVASTFAIAGAVDTVVPVAMAWVWSWAVTITVTCMLSSVFDTMCLSD